jgi:phage shock protein A
MGIFSRTLDIMAANFTELIDRAEDPAKMIRMIILEMEETLVEVRASAARTIADQKEMHRHTVKLDRLQADWADKAQLALSKDREDLARAALVEKRKAGDMAEQLKAEIAVLDDSLRAYEADIEKLQNRLREARSRQTQIAARLESAENRVKLRTLLTTNASTRRSRGSTSSNAGSTTPKVGPTRWPLPRAVRNPPWPTRFPRSRSATRSTPSSRK